MNGLPLISIIVPIYNVEKSLGRCIDSLLAQTYKNTEIILVDDGSPDNCGKICDDYAKSDSRVKVIHRENGGVAAARNSGIDAATGEYIAFVDPDDYVTKDFLEFMYNNITATGADISSCGALVVHPSGKIEKQPDAELLFVVNSREALERMCYNDGFYITLWDKLFKAKLFNGVRCVEGKLFEDTGTTYKLVDNAEKIAICCQPKYYYVVSNDASSITTSKFKMSKMDYVEMADQMAEFIIKKYPDLKPAAERKQLHACLSTLIQLVNSSCRNKEVETLLIKRIKTLRKGALKNPHTPNRDKFGIIALCFGFKFFSFAWKIYSLKK